MPTINITVAEKIATNTTPGEVIVCGNSDYTLSFTFDSEWSALGMRTARFVYYKDGLSLYQDVTFTGNTVAVPVLSGIDYVLVGVYAGELHTTTPAKVLCDRSILCGDPLEALPPEEKAKLQAQIGDLSKLTTSAKSDLVAAINELKATGGGAVTDEQITAAVEAYLEEHPIEGGGATGENGATFTPAVSPAGVLSWTNDKGLTNPDPVDIKGPQGPQGPYGMQGRDGSSVYYANTIDVSYDDTSGLKFIPFSHIEYQQIEPKAGDIIITAAGLLFTVVSTDGENAYVVGNTNLKGDKGDQGIQGEQGPKGDTGEQGSQGEKGDQGEPGKTPVRGEDYWTETDKTAIVDEVIAALGTPVFGSVDAENNIILTGELVSGTYTVKYEMDNGELVTIGTLTQDASDDTGVEVIIPVWIKGKKINATTGELTDESNYAYSEDIPFIDGTEIHISCSDCSDFRCSWYYYDANDNLVSTQDWVMNTTGEKPEEAIPEVDGAVAVKLRCNVVTVDDTWADLDRLTVTRVYL